MHVPLPAVGCNRTTRQTRRLRSSTLPLAAPSTSTTARAASQGLTLSPPLEVFLAGRATPPPAAAVVDVVVPASTAAGGASVVVVDDDVVVDVACVVVVARGSGGVVGGGGAGSGDGGRGRVAGGAHPPTV